MAGYRILLVHPGSPFSTHDVWSGMRAGFVDNGVEVIDYHLDKVLMFYNTMIGTAQEQKVLSGNMNAFAYAGPPVTALAAFHHVDAVVVVSGHNLHTATPITIRHMDAWNQLDYLEPRTDAEAQAKTEAMRVLREAGLHKRLDIPVAVYCTESPYFDLFEHNFARAYDIVFTNERLSVDLFTQNERVYYLPHAYNPQVHTPGTVDPIRKRDVYFVGSGFDERKALFHGVDWTDIAFECQGYLWQDTESIEDVRDNAEVVHWYRSAAICLNHHRTTKTYQSRDHVTDDTISSLNPRTYEIAACGAFQLCDDSRAELHDVFGGTVPTYKRDDSADLERQIRYWLTHPDERERLARAQHDAVQPHTWTARTHDMLNILFN